VLSQHGKWDASLYDDKHSFVWKMAADLLELLAPKPGERILDIGCGTGHLTAQIAASGAEILGIDASPDMIQQARAAHSNLQFEVADARALSFYQDFDAVFSNATLHWIPEPERVASCISNALRSGGRFVAEFGGKGNVAALISAFSHAWAALSLPEPFPNPWYYPSLAQYSALLECYGLETTYGSLFDRPTPLEDGQRGLRNWLEMFAGTVLAKAPAELRQKLITEVEQQARADLFQDSTWVMDYRRLRIVAQKL
jgi:trans-aconitate methyltransferase